jgi:hypothetical protein
VAAADLLGQVLGQVPDTPGRVFGSGEHALGVELGPEPGRMQRLIRWADRVESLIPGGQDLPGGGVEVGAAGFVPDWQLAAVVADGVGGGPPDLVVGGGDDLAQVGARDGAAVNVVLRHVRCPTLQKWPNRPTKIDRSRSIRVGGYGPLLH